MDEQFWINAWDEGRTAFHQAKANDKLLQYFPLFNPQKGQSVLVPLCGKSKDLIWLYEHGLHVRGVELYEQPVKAFFEENQLTNPAIVQDKNFKNYTYGKIVLSCGDFFELEERESFDFIYDRAALVALPESMRKNYAQVIKNSLKQNGKCLLISYHYNENEMEGPPFSVPADEIQQLFSDTFEIKLMESTGPQTESSRLSKVPSIKQQVYVLQKNK